MSHFTRIATKMVDPDFLVAALRDLGYEPHRNGIVRGWGGNTTHAEVVVQSGSPGYDIGFRREAGAFQLVADWFGIRGLRQADLIARLGARYAYNATLAKLDAQGFSMVDESIDEAGTVRILLRRVS